MKTVIFIQARMDSTRLPGKVLLKLCGKSIIEYIADRLTKIHGIDEIVLATGLGDQNNVLAEEAKRIGLGVARGSEENVLDRFYKANKEVGADVIVRVTGDCPFIDVELIENGLEIFKNGDYDLVGISRQRSYPDGVDYEVFSASALEKAWQNEGQNTERFIPPTKYLMESKIFRVKDIVSEIDLKRIRLTLDYPEDFELIEKIATAFHEERNYFGMSEILEYLHAYPGLQKINEMHIKEDYGIKAT
jgi:spore coat polysaccharide biosynthesis protein SpsF